MSPSPKTLRFREVPAQQGAFNSKSPFPDGLMYDFEAFLGDFEVIFVKILGG